MSRILPVLHKTTVIKWNPLKYLNSWTLKLGVNNLVRRNSFVHQILSHLSKQRVWTYTVLQKDSQSSGVTLFLQFEEGGGSTDSKTYNIYTNFQCLLVLTRKIMFTVTGPWTDRMSLRIDLFPRGCRVATPKS